MSENHNTIILEKLLEDALADGFVGEEAEAEAERRFFDLPEAEPDTDDLND